MDNFVNAILSGVSWLSFRSFNGEGDPDRFRIFHGKELEMNQIRRLVITVAVFIGICHFQAALFADPFQELWQITEVVHDDTVADEDDGNGSADDDAPDDDDDNDDLACCG